MLEPNVRALFLDSLRPPPGCTLDQAVGTTFTVDLMAALTVPLALAGYNLSGAADPIAVMQALRTTTSKVDVFAQAGMIASNNWPGDLTALLEPMLHTLPRPRPGHLFHPKVWVLRFLGGDGASSYRCIVSSRNLTADRSWDILLRLDSDPEAHKINPDNQGLVALIESLPKLGQRDLPAERGDRVLQLAAELRRVTWELPDGSDSLRFLAFGVAGGMSRAQRSETFRGYRHVLIAPFLTNDGIDELIGTAKETELTIVSRAESIDALDADWLENASMYTLNPLAEFNDGEAASETLLGGLHAKVYVIEAAKRAYVYVGSANATSAAFNGNVELLCELGGGPKALGVGQLLADGSPFKSLLEEYRPARAAAEIVDDTVARALQSLLVDLGGASYALEVTEHEKGWQPRLTSPDAITPPTTIAGAALTIAPFNSAHSLQPLAPGAPVDVKFGASAAADLTPFFVVTASAPSPQGKLTRSAVIKATLVNEPAGRLDDVMIRQLDEPEKFLRFVMLLLALGGDAPTGFDVGQGSNAAAWQRSLTMTGLFELLVRALAANPEALDSLEQIVDHLRESPLAEKVLPPGWDEVWKSIARARVLIGREATA